ncbi:DUF3727 domain-containing protein [Synechococcus sp. RSCCF101]|uniref:DUF3727 domain-containing protein n=1 Tax=Synechococcus sp. RSCCF101 TaxID=2511069 RepID=UPI0012463A43|nr:DUF3727 domain-containing protein [Synechococcus sp. RSCCF101]QEY31654.1 DUF3727 domain-containing protein [Synechococcus sp. RSCCF101]
MSSESPSIGGDVPTVLVRDSLGRALLCYLEELIPLEGRDYGLLTPVDTPVSLFRLPAEGEPELVESLEESEPILSQADVVLQEFDLTLVRSAVTLTVSGELEDGDPEDLEDEEDLVDDAETYELLKEFQFSDQNYGLYIPLDPFFVVARIQGGAAELVEGDEFDRLQPLIERELEERDASG